MEYLKSSKLGLRLIALSPEENIVTDTKGVVLAKAEHEVYMACIAAQKVACEALAQIVSDAAVDAEERIDAARLIFDLERTTN